MKIKIIFGWMPVEEENKLESIPDYASLLDDSFGDCEKVLNQLEREGHEYFRTWNPVFVDHLSKEDTLEKVFIWDKSELKPFKTFPKLIEYLPYFTPGEIISATDFSKDWKQ